MEMYKKLIALLAGLLLITQAYSLGAGQPCEYSKQCDYSQQLVCKYVPQYGKLCVKEMDVGGQCSDKTWTCKKGLYCDKYQKCAYPQGGKQKVQPAQKAQPVQKPQPAFPAQGPMKKVLSKQNGPCMGDKYCPQGLKCQYVGKYKTCVKEMGVGQQCSDRSWVCKKGLTCWKGECYMFMGQGGKCNDPYWKCKPGYYCGKNGYCSSYASKVREFFGKKKGDFRKYFGQKKEGLKKYFGGKY